MKRKIYKLYKNDVEMQDITTDPLVAIVKQNCTRLSDFRAKIRKVETEKGAWNSMGLLVVSYRFSPHTGRVVFDESVASYVQAEATISRVDSMYIVRDYQPHATYAQADKAIRATFDVFNAAQQLAEQKKQRLG